MEYLGLAKSVHNIPYFFLFYNMFLVIGNFFQFTYQQKKKKISSSDILNHLMQDEELDISPVEIDDALVIEDDDISDDEDDDHEDVCLIDLLTFVFYHSLELEDDNLIFALMLLNCLI